MEEAKANLATSSGFKDVPEAAYFVDLKKTTIAEAKKTRKLFDLILSWSQDSAKLNASINGRLGSTSSKASSKRRKVSKGGKSEKENAKSILLEILRSEDDSSLAVSDRMESSVSAGSTATINVGVQDGDSQTPKMPSAISNTSSEKRTDVPDDFSSEALTSKRVSFDSVSVSQDTHKKSLNIQPALEKHVNISPSVSDASSPNEGPQIAQELEPGMQQVSGRLDVDSHTEESNVNSLNSQVEEGVVVGATERRESEIADDYLDEEDDSAAPNIQKVDTYCFLDMCVAIIKVNQRKAQQKVIVRFHYEVGYSK